MDGFEWDGMEKWGARDRTPEEMCRECVAMCDVFVGIVGHLYGSSPPGGDKSYTEIEYDEARKRRKPRLMFVAPDEFSLPARLRESDDRRRKQDRFRARVNEERVRDSFSTPEDLARRVVQAIHNWASGGKSDSTTNRPTEPAAPGAPTRRLSRAVEKAMPRKESAGGRRSVGDPEAMTARAVSLATDDARGQFPLLTVALIGNTNSPIMRPAEFEAEKLEVTLMREAMFGATPVFRPGGHTEVRRSGATLLIEQERAAFRVDELGTIRITIPAADEDMSRRGLLMLIEEDMRAGIERCLRFSARVLNVLDGTKQISHIAIAVALTNAGYLGWRTRAEHERNPNSWSGGRGRDPIVVCASPAIRARESLTREARRLAEDLTVYLRREWQD